MFIAKAYAENGDNGNKKFFSGYKLGASLKNY